MAKSNALTGIITDIHRTSTVDGPGIRTTVFTKGCPLRCVWCHNPETQSFFIEKGYGREASVEEIAAECLKDRVYYELSGGGVTLSGGEPLGQATFVKAFFEEVKQQWGLHTALDTQGNLGSRLDDDWFEPVDLILLDIKHMDDARHQALTAFPVAPTLEFAKRMAGLGKELWIRHVVVPGWTDEEEHAQKLADFVATLPTVTRVELLPFHQLGAHKWKELNLEYKLKDTIAPSEAVMNDLRRVFLHRGLPVS